LLSTFSSNFIKISAPSIFATRYMNLLFNLFDAGIWGRYLSFELLSLGKFAKDYTRDSPLGGGTGGGGGEGNMGKKGGATGGRLTVNNVK
jgi:hypothetical protein